MLRDRLAVILILVPLGTAILLAGGLWFTVLLAALMILAGWEFSRLFSRQGMNIPMGIVGVGVAVFILSRWFYGFDYIGVLLVGMIFLTMIWFLVRYDTGGEKHAASGMLLTIGGIIYLGWFASYLVSLRQLPYGFWWTLLSLAAVGLTDSMAYLVGRAFGKHPLTRLISPKKTWEGYFGGLAGGALGGFVIGWFLTFPAGTASGINPLRGALLGLLVGMLSPLGDLTISLMKREAAQKDSGDFFPGHGGILDRIDSWLVMAVVAYYFISALVPLLPF